MPNQARLLCDFERIGFGKYRCKRFSCGQTANSHIDFTVDKVFAECRATWQRTIFTLLTIILVGDAIAKLAEVLGIDIVAERLAKDVGKSECGCKDRQQWLNWQQQAMAGKFVWTIEWIVMQAKLLLGIKRRTE